MTASTRNMPLRLGGALLASPELLVPVPVVTALVLRLWRAWQDIPTIVLEATSDDAYYYFQIARNIASGHNVTFDGENLTNGFHPLWMAVLTPVYLITDSPEVPVHIALTLASLLAAGTVLLVFAIVRTLTDNSWASLVAAAFYAVHPYLTIESINGMETALTVFMVALTMWLFLRIARREGRTPPAGYALLGASGGLMVLARTDSVFILAPMLLFLLARERGRLRFMRPLAAGGTALLVIAPWAMWSLVTFGTAIQVSGIAVADMERQAFLDANGSSFLTQLDRAWDVTSTALFDWLPHLYFVPEGGPKTPVLLMAAGFLALMLVAPLSPQRRLATRQIGLLLVPTVGVVSMLLFHSAIRWHVREWYFAPMALVGATFLGIGINYVHGLARGTRLSWRARTEQHDPPEHAPAPRPRQPRGRSLPLRPALLSAALYCVVCLGLVVWYGPQRSEDFDRDLPHRLNMLEAARWLEDNTEPDARVGSLNAGIIGYFSDRTVINLDGVVNEGAYEARRDGRLLEYVLSNEICYLVDLPGALAFAVEADDPDPGFERVAVIGKGLYYFSGGRPHVLRLAPDAAGTSSACGPTLTAGDTVSGP